MWDLPRIEVLAKRLPQQLPASLFDLPRDFVLYEDDAISVLYAPVGFVNPQAKLALVGLTPGRRQATIAYEVAAELIAGGVSPSEVHRVRKPAVAFAGSMRGNLVSMLDAIGIPTRLGVASSADLFGTGLLHTCSALRFPVFKHGKNYAGGGPSPTKHPALRAMLEEILAPELAAVSDALIVPLGKAVSLSLDHLVAQDLLAAQRVLRGFPHPSGANGHRKRSFETEQKRLEQQVADWFDGSSGP